MKAPTVFIPKDHHARITDDGNQVYLMLDGKVTEMTAEAAIAIARGLIAKARKVMELRPKVAEQIIADEALLLRAGVPFSLSGNPKIRAEAEKEAEHNRDLRKYLPGGIKSDEHVPPPTVSNVPGTAPGEKQ